MTLMKMEDTDNRKGKYYIAINGGLALEKAMDL
jgi:hypothetical protein